MAHTEYQYQIVTEKENDKFLNKVNGQGRKGWRIIHYSVTGVLVTAVMELSTSLNESSKG